MIAMNGIAPTSLPNIFTQFLQLITTSSCTIMKSGQNPAAPETAMSEAVRCLYQLHHREQSRNPRRRRNGCQKDGIGAVPSNCRLIARAVGAMVICPTLQRWVGEPNNFPGVPEGRRSFTATPAKWWFFRLK
jgi:hypothetical protein